MSRLMTRDRLENIARKPFAQMFPEKLALIQQYKCPTCEQDINDSDFKNTISVMEYYISGMCQSCQDKVFGKPRDDDEERWMGECYYHWCKKHDKLEPLCGELGEKCIASKRKLKKYEKRRDEELKFGRKKDSLLKKFVLFFPGLIYTFLFILGIRKFWKKHPKVELNTDMTQFLPAFKVREMDNIVKYYIHYQPKRLRKLIGKKDVEHRRT